MTDSFTHCPGYDCIKTLNLLVCIASELDSSHKLGKDNIYSWLLLCQISADKRFYLSRKSKEQHKFQCKMSFKDLLPIHKAD